MQPSSILTIIISVVCVDFLRERMLEFLNIKNLKEELPAALKGVYSEEKYQKSKEYLRVNTRFSIVSATFNLVVLLALLYAGLLGILDRKLQQFITDPKLLSLAFFGVLFIIGDILNLPFSYYKTFVIETKFGFNKMNLQTFFKDKVKGYLIGAIIGGGLLYLLLSLIIFLGVSFWIYFWVLLSIFLVFINIFYTTLFIPLFNKLKPLEEGELRNALQEYSRKAGFPLENIFVLDGSKRSSKANAFFSGLGSRKKIVLYDTLIKNHTTEELVAILAHEVGHYKKKHIVTGIVLSVVQLGFMLWLLSKLLFDTNLSSALGGEHLSYHLNLIAFGILFTPVSLLAGLLGNMVSRKDEYEADTFAATTYNATALQTGLKKLSGDNLSNLVPHAWYVFFHYSHPPLINRLKNLEKYIYLK